MLLKHGDTQLKNDRNVLDYNIKGFEYLYVDFRLLGGGFIFIFPYTEKVQEKFFCKSS